MKSNHWNWDGDPNEYFGFIYRITEVPTGRMYIGKKQFKSTTRKAVPGRKNKQVIYKDSNWRSYTGSSQHLNKAITANGIENYKFEIISLHYSKGALHYAEVELQVKEDVLRKKLSDGTPMYYNKNIAGTKFIPPDEMSDKTRAKLSAATSASMTPERRTKQSISLKGNTNKLGKKLSDETKSKISNASKGKPSPKKGKLGKKTSDETKSKISATLKGRFIPTSTCPHCNKTGGTPQMIQWHFDNCKMKKPQ